MMVGQCNELDNTPIPPVTFAVRVKNATFGSMFDHNRPSFEKEQLIKQKKTWGADKWSVISKSSCYSVTSHEGDYSRNC